MFRDDPAFALYAEQLFVAWKTGQGQPVADMDVDTFDDLYLLIREWTIIERENGYFRIGCMIGGDPDKKETDSKSGSDNRGVP